MRLGRKALRRPLWSRREVLAGAAVASGGLWLAAQGGEAPKQGMMRMALSAYPPSLAAFQHSGMSAAAVKLMIHRGLVGYDAQGAIRGEVAERFVSEDERTWLFHLRPDAVFHNGDPVTAQDVRHTIDLITAETSTAYLKSAFLNVEQVEIVDPLTIRIRLRSPSATFIYHLASFNAPVISAKSTQDSEIGCGPFRIVAQERGVRIDLEAFPQYYRAGLPRTQHLRCTPFTDENLRVAALTSGDIDIIEYVPWQAMDHIAANPDLRLDAANGPFMGLVFNFRQGPFADSRVRQAVAYAINRDDIVKAAFFGRGAPLEGLPVAPGSAFHNATRDSRWRRDLDRSRALLAEAGLAGGFRTTLLSSGQYNMHKDTAEIVQQSLAAIDIQVDLRLPDYATRLQLGNAGQYEFAVVGYSLDYEDPDAMSAFLTGPNDSYLRSFGYRNETTDRLLEEGRAQRDLNARRLTYDRLVHHAMDEAAMVGLAWRSQGYAMRRNVQGFANLPGSLSFYSPATLESAVFA